MSFFPFAAVQPSPRPFDPTKTRLVNDFKHANPLLGCRIDPTGTYVFASSQDNSIVRWEIATLKKTALTGHRSWVRGLAFEPRSKTLLSADYTGKILFWSVDAAEPQVLRQFEAHRGWARAVAVSPDGRTFATCGNDNLIKLWDFEKLDLIRTFTGHEWHVYNVAFHPSGRQLASGDLRGNVKQWDIATGQATRSYDASTLYKYDPTFRADIGGIRSMAFNADGSQLLCSGITNCTNAFAGIGNPAYILFNWQSGERTQIYRPQAAFQGTGWGVAFHSNNLIVGSAGGNGGALFFWRPDNANSFHTVTLPANARDLSLHPDGRRLAIPFFDGSVRVYEMA